MHKISRATILEMCQVQDIIQTMDLRRARWIEKLSHMDFTRCPRLLFGCWLCGRVYHRDSKPLKTIGHSHTDSLKRIGEASFLEDGVATIAPFVKKAGSITVAPRTYPLFQLVQSKAWPSMMEKYLGLEPGTYATFKPTAPGQMPPRRSRAVIAIEPSTPSNDRGPAVCGNCRCVDCLGPPCLSPLSRPPLCNSCGFRHGPTCTQCSLITTNENNAVITEPFTADDVEVAVNELSPRSTQSVSRAAMSPMTNALANATVAAATASVEEDTEVPVPRRTTRSQSARLNLAATFEGFVPANNPNAWRDRDLE